MVEGAPLLREYAVIPHRGFESLPLRQNILKSLLLMSFCRLPKVSSNSYPQGRATSLYPKFTANWTHSGPQYLRLGGTHGPPRVPRMGAYQTSID